MALGKILPRGQVTLPSEIRRAAGLAPGDPVSFRVTGEGTVEIRALPKLTLADLLERYRVPDDVDVEAELKGQYWQDDAVKDIFGSSDE